MEKEKVYKELLVGVNQPFFTSHKAEIVAAESLDRLLHICDKCLGKNAFINVFIFCRIDIVKIDKIEKILITKCVYGASGKCHR